MQRPILLVAALAALAACGGGDGFEYSGTPGQPVAAHFGGDVLPDVAVRVNGGAEHFFTVDTGAPVTILNGSTFTDHADGVHRDDLGAFALTFKGVTDVSYKNYGGDGLLGGDVLRHFAFTLDYEGDRVWLSDPYDAKKNPADVLAGAERKIPFELLGGGTGVAFNGCTGAGCRLTYPATRVVVQARFEGAAAPVWVLVDTGASIVLLDDSLFGALAVDARRPRLDGVQLVGVNDGPQTAFLTRVWRLTLEGTGTTVVNPVDDLVAGVVPGWTLLASLSQEVGKPVKALVGATYLRHHLVTVDYQAGVLRFAAYTNPQKIEVNEFVGPGFQLDSSGSSWVIYEVYPGRDAYTKGLRTGDVVEQIGTMPLTGQPASVVQQALDSFELGQEMPVTFSRSGTMQTVNVLVEDLLPHYPAPT